MDGEHHKEEVRGLFLTLRNRLDLRATSAVAFNVGDTELINGDVGYEPTAAPRMGNQ